MYRVIQNQFVRDLSNYPIQVGTKKIAKRVTARQAVKELSNGSRI